MLDAVLEQSRHIRLTTFRKDGREVTTPVWLVPIAGKLYFYTSGDSGKVKRIRATHKVKVAPSDFRGNARGPAVEGTAAVVDDPALVKLANRAIAVKYGFWHYLVQAIVWVGRDRNRVVVELNV
jgi:hypothetical protein